MRVCGRMVVFVFACLATMVASAVLERISPVLNGEMLHVICDMGHGEEIVISDANFPAHSVCDNVIRADGMPAARLLEGIAPLFTLDQYSTPVIMMSPVRGDALDPAVEVRYRAALGYTNTIERLERQKFYERAKKARAVIVSGEMAKYGNVILKKGVVPCD